MEPKCFEEGYCYIGKDEKWHIKADAPDWAKKEFKEFMHSDEPKNDIITQYE